MVYTAKGIANAFLDIAERHGKPISPLKLQKLIYFAHGWSLTLLNKPLINEPVEAWKFGPVIQSVYHEFKRFGANYITAKATDIDMDSDEFKLVETPSPEDEDTLTLLEKVFEVYGDLSGIQLSNMTHEDGTPWSQTQHGDETPDNIEINQESIKNHFTTLANN